MLKKLYMLCLLLMTTAIASAQDAPEIVTTVNETSITAEAFQQRYTLEGYLLVREMGTYAAIIGADPASSDLNEEDIIDTLRLAFPVQFQAFDDPERFGDIILNSMESELLLPTDDIEITEEDIDLQVAQHVVTTTPALFNADPVPALVSPAVEEAAAAFYEDVEAAVGASREDVRDLFAARVLRQRVFEDITAGVAEDEQTQAFQEWVLARRTEATIQRSEEWQQATPVELDLNTLLEQRVLQTLAGG